MLPTTDAERKGNWPLWDFMFNYFPKAWLAVVQVAVQGNKQHNPGETGIRWAREKSTDQLNTAFRHLFDYGTGTKIDTDGQYHLAKAIWRLMAQLQVDIENEEDANGRGIERGCGERNAVGDISGQLELQYHRDGRPVSTAGRAYLVPNEETWQRYLYKSAGIGECK